MASNQPNNNKNQPDKNPNFFNQNPLMLFAIFSIVAILLFKSLSPEGEGGEGLGGKLGGSTINKSVNYFELKKLIENKEVNFVAIGQGVIKAVSDKNGVKTIYNVKRVTPDDTLIPLLDKHEVEYSGYTEGNWFTDMLFGWILPVFIFFALWMFLASRMQKNMGGGILGMGSSKKLVNSEKPKVKFDDMAGNDEAKDEVVEIVDFLKNPDRYLNLGAKIPKGVLLVGPPGTGKTLLAKAVAGEASVPFFSVSGSSFIEMFVGVGASRVRDLFETAKKESPSIIFIDEIDAIGKSRAAGGMISGNDEREQTLNQLLAEMDGFSSDSSPVIVLAATNRPEVLDPALLRPGRFDRQVLVDKPDYNGRVEILKVHIQSIKIARDVDLYEIARLTAGLAGADLANIVNEAALLAGRANKKEVQQSDFREAVERGIAGLEKKSRRISPKEKRIVAYHESGHALLAEITKGAKRVSKVSIIPRGLAALGYTLNTPEENKYLMQKHELIAEVDVLLGGRAAEEVFIGEISTGASNDLERATDIIKAMVSYYGMTDVVGLMVLEKQKNVFLGGGMGSSREFSDKTAQEVDAFVKASLSERYEAVKKSLESYKGAIETTVKELFDKETIDGVRVREIIRSFEEENGMETRLVPLESELD
ncbi:ATP-dependent zinc metalloprotease FtsH [Wolinella succinogenes]|uniref:ATP-dependent zinc metalloprotease FtsH n=1 Tax=Wolinella succinogenes (strain ATCC 29543 / DSM 1740 / CCUG 13145 / JCM 31913 / LMG 7466 / NCTC 11488 / FDC 602W) TaxID=273121 RepID=Q7M9W6_WOLSU|nr:ATP-dependent zinc metalloprotease FtsH [Wolinella succinogenes]NLU33390.1 ATP-dependent zinc metalloprotease FtsH [Wolinella succinogenes]CAE09752.1 ZINC METALLOPEPTIDASE [Wolinella succinogenes]VEG81967.1 ATP-dependent zinc metalloprotease FtsH [Wolinella succinogenes]HCZ19373.1 ATP-dependent zinc metalloprotease FtsH [Helicobacter sp.]